MTDIRPLTAHRHRSGVLLTGALCLTLAAGWAVHHGLQAAQYGHNSSRLAVVWLATFGLLASQTLLYHLERPRRVTPRAQRQLDALHAAILLPVYNEDPGYLRLGLESLLAQTRRPTSVHVVDDGSTSSQYTEVRAWWEQAARAAGIATTWQRTPNQGKRHAQAAAVRQALEADVYVTVDSDSCLAPNALEELLKPFARAEVMSVAGIVLATNHRANLLARITDLWFVTGQLTDRSSLSATGTVLVNSGPLAAYRSGIVLGHLQSYLNETFMGRRVSFSDDSLLTLFALLHGRTVQQPTAVVFTALPEKWSHFSRMYMRWMRGSTIRSVWRFRYLPLTGWAYWAHMLRWFQVALSTGVLVWLLAVEPLAYDRMPPASFLVVPFLIGWAQGLRYLSIARSDDTTARRLVTWLLMPIAVIGAWTVLRCMRWWGAATCARTGWGTRQNGAEVSLTTAADEPPAPARPGDDTLRMRIPVAKLLDPDTETTLSLPIPRQRTAAPQPEGTAR